MPKSHYFADQAIALVVQERTTSAGEKYRLSWYRAPFAVDGIVYVPPDATDRWVRRGGEAPMISLRNDQPGACGGWHWRPPGCPTAEALAIVKAGEYL